MKDTLNIMYFYDKINDKGEVNYLKRSAKKMFLKGLLQSFFIVPILLGVCVLSYRVSIHFLGDSKQSAIVAYKEYPVEEPITKATIEDISKNIIFSYDREASRINKIVLEIFNSEKKQISYITIPTRTQFTMSETLYRKLVLIQPSMPQVIKLSAIANYLEPEYLFEYGVLIMEDLLGTEISYYTVIPEDTYKSIFTEESTTLIEEELEVLEEDRKEQEDTLPVEVFTKKYKKKLKQMKTEGAIKDYLEEIYPTLQSNLSLQDKLTYLESYSKTTIDDVTFVLMTGENENSGYRIDQQQITLQLSEITYGK
jgi:hypothetical protein